MAITSDDSAQPALHGRQATSGSETIRTLSNAARPWYKRFIPKSLRTQATLLIVVPVLILQVITTWLFYDRHYETMTKRLAQAVAGEVAALVEIMERRPPDADNWEIFDWARRRLEIYPRLEPGGTIGQPPEFFFRNVVQEKLEIALSRRLEYPFTVDTRERDELSVVQVQLPEGVLHVQVRHKRLFSSNTYFFIAWMLVSAGALVLIAQFIMNRQVRTLRRFARVADRFGKGQDVADFKPVGPTEVKQAARAFLRMRERIARQVQQRTTLLAGVSHDLRTPLTRMRLELELMGESPETDALKSDVAQMQRMIEGYLAFARGEGREDPVDCNVADLLRQAVRDARNEKIHLSIPTKGSFEMLARRDALSRCIANLIDNAARHGNRVEVSATSYRKGIEIVIDDDGPGLPFELREEAFKPFVSFRRRDSDDNHDTARQEPGSETAPATEEVVGLGLSIARDIAINHGGQLELLDSPLGGLRARLWLPS